MKLRNDEMITKRYAQWEEIEFSASFTRFSWILFGVHPYKAAYLTSQDYVLLSSGLFLSFIVMCFWCLLVYFKGMPFRCWRQRWLWYTSWWRWKTETSERRGREKAKVDQKLVLRVGQLKKLKIPKERFMQQIYRHFILRHEHCP